MAKATSRKHATQRKTHASRAAKPRARHAMKSAPTRVTNPPEIVPDPEMVGEDVADRAEAEPSEPRDADEGSLDEPEEEAG